MALITKLAWLALPVLVGCGALTQVPSDGAGVNQGSEGSRIKLSQQGLPWPANPTPTTIEKDYSWEQEFKQAGSAKNLPYYGKATPAEVVAGINSVWNASKHVQHVPGQNVSQTWKRIKEVVDPVISSLGYEPTAAHRQVLYDAGIATFISTQMTYGEADQAIPGLGRNEILSYAVNDEESGIKHATNLLKQRQLLGVCADITSLQMALQNEAGIVSVAVSVTIREGIAPAVVQTGPADPRNHSVVVTLYPTKEGNSLSRDQRGSSPLTSYSRVLSDPTLFILSTEQKRNLNQITRFPKMAWFSAGAKGDDVFRVRFAAKNMARYLKMPDGSDYTKVVEFRPGAIFAEGKQLDRSFVTLIEQVDAFHNEYMR